MFSYKGCDIGVFLSNANFDPLNGGTDKQYKAVKLSSGKVDATAANGDVVFGILQDQPRAGYPCAVRVSGVSKMVAGEAIALNAPVYLDGATGKCLAGSAAVGARFLGTALAACGGNNELVTVLLAEQNTFTSVKV